MKHPFVMIIFVVIFYSCSTKNQSSLIVPACLSAKIDSIKKDGKVNPPQSVIQYNYKGAVVYYVTAGCCDQFNVVYDANCKDLGAPDGGITGKGDGRLKDFFAVAADKKVVWENK